jgi:branched-subunit amino acid transport protein
MSVFGGILVAGIGAYLMRASFILLLSGVVFPARVLRILDHVGPAVMAALVATTLTGKDGQLEAGLTECVTLIVMAAVTLWRRDLLSGLLVALVVFFVGNAIL